MLKNLRQIFATRRQRHDLEAQQATVDAWSLHFGREAAKLWVEAMLARDADRLSNA